MPLSPDVKPATFAAEAMVSSRAFKTSVAACASSAALVAAAAAAVAS